MPECAIFAVERRGVGTHSRSRGREPKQRTEAGHQAGDEEASAVTMTTENYQDLLAEEIRKLEQEFRSRRDNGRRMSRSVAAAYRKSIEQRAEQLRNLDDKH